MKNNKTGALHKLLHPDSVCRLVAHYGAQVGITEAAHGFRTDSLRATAATNALEHGAGIAKVQEWLGHAGVSSTRLYGKRQSRPKDSPTLERLGISEAEVEG